MRILLLGGTKDSTNIIEHVKKNHDCFILTTTTTEYGARLAKEAGSDEVIARPLPKEEIIDIIKNEKIGMLIDATHPFAEHITRTSVSIANELEMPYIRFERPTTNLENIDTSHIHYADSFDMAGKLIESEFRKGNVLHFAGANTMEDILKYVSVDRFYPRILKVESSIEKCEKLGVDPSHIIPMKGAASVEENIELIERYGASVMITKESGDVGGVIEKILAANEKDVAVIMIQRPKIDELNKNDIVSNLDELDIKLKSFF
ncbi:MAG: precorrin-6A reductase [Methanobrevibacter thaueri]|jgi:precorrin-6A/cobalt-precorrin-6A reductase|uniref:Precorrin-6A reductase n=1 Tax=Methanobrevibacter thaueri TaxID=190975 RepID=A0A8T3V6G3_9EURY|nr:precorrin-6A reductase [Methanobrevibacter thaueri]MBE6502182.1 precorrin-6A reductase [Methanobrevibacter thaueri]